MSERLKIEAPKRLLEGGEGPDAEACRRALAQLGPEQGWELARERVWRRLSLEPRRSSVWRPIGLSLATAGALVLVAALCFQALRPGMRATPIAGQLYLAEGRVLCTGPTGEWTELEAGRTFEPGARLRTEAGRAVIRFPGLASIHVGANTELSVEPAPAGVFLRLAGGELTAKVGPRPANSPFLIQSSQHRVRVIGTLFSVRERSPAPVEVAVREGTVEGSGNAGTTFLHAGQSWNGASAIDDELGALLERALRGDPLLQGNRSESAKAPDQTASAANAEPPVPAMRPTTVPPALSQRERVVALAESHGLPSSAASAKQPAEGGELLPPVPLPAAPPPPSDYERALDLSRQGQYPAAAALLEDVVKRRAAHADLALYELGRLRQRQLSDIPGAIASFDRYRAEYPQGTLSQEVSLSLIESLLARSEGGRALSEASRFLEDFPGSERAAEVRFWRANLRRQNGGCSDALADYAEVVQSGQRFADDALFFSAWCQHQLGRASAELETLKLYLARFPAGSHRAEVQKALGAR